MKLVAKQYEKGEAMENSWLTIILVFVIIGGMAFFILLSTANDVDKTLEASVQQDISTFVKECANEGRVTAEKVNELETNINSNQAYGFAEKEITTTVTDVINCNGKKESLNEIINIDVTPVNIIHLHSKRLFSSQNLYI